MALAPEIAVSRWFNTSEPLTLSGLRGRPVLLHAFQMLCPGCVAHGTPQTQRAFDLFKHSDLQVIGLHTVFEHHAAMTPVSLEAFLLPLDPAQPSDHRDAEGRVREPMRCRAPHLPVQGRHPSKQAQAAADSPDAFSAGVRV